ncbi:hypothetical protein H5410_030229 [Solanum commersonii]|uniref:Non-haem dioxygenase N-terminal domain-containing protein n=1 Tax=Solanum commersonii TaxID=4109 RepID=A0A9J5YDQ0_SOLCO|nr:hypothetical protein H5410_030229 [Solanum commersonii]
MTSPKFEPNDDILDFVIKKADGIKEHIILKSQIDNQESIPTIHLSNFYDLNVKKPIQEAARKWGCFQIINHGIPIEVLEDLKDAAHKFVVLPTEEKVKYCKDNNSAGEFVLIFWSDIGEKKKFWSGGII